LVLILGVLLVVRQGSVHIILVPPLTTMNRQYRKRVSWVQYSQK
jgi:hypothetical protein